MNRIAVTSSHFASFGLIAVILAVSACGSKSEGASQQTDTTRPDTTQAAASPLAPYVSALTKCSEIITSAPPSTDEFDIIWTTKMALSAPTVTETFVSFTARFDPAEKDGEGDGYDRLIDFDTCLDNVARSVPEVIMAKMGNTRALDGTLEDDVDGLHFTWNYHPDSGLSITIEAV